MTDMTPKPTDAVQRVRGCLSDGVTPSLTSVRELLADRDRLHAIYKAADKTLREFGCLDEDHRERALFELAAIIGAYEGGTLP
jgi:hypothetical protein